MGESRKTHQPVRGWQPMALWRKAVYFAMALFLGALLAGAITAMVEGLLYIVVALTGWTWVYALGFAAFPVAWIWGTAFFFRWMREDIEYIDSDEHLSKINESTVPQHWP